MQVLIFTCFSNVTSNVLHSWWSRLPSSWYWISHQFKAGMYNCLSYKFLSKYRYYQSEDAKYEEYLIFCNEYQWIARLLYGEIDFVAKLNAQTSHVFHFSFQQYINCSQPLLKVSRHFSYKDHSFSTYKEFSEKRTFLTPWYARIHWHNRG